MLEEEDNDDDEEVVEEKEEEEDDDDLNEEYEISIEGHAKNIEIVLYISTAQDTEKR